MIRISRPTKDGYVRLSIRVIHKGQQITKSLGIKVHKSQIRRKKIVNHPYANELNKKLAEELFKVRELVCSLGAGLINLDEVKGLNKGVEKDLEKGLLEHVYNTKSASAYGLYTVALRTYKRFNNQSKLEFSAKALNNLILNYEGSGSTINTYVASIKALNKEAYKLGLVRELIDSNRLHTVKKSMSQLTTVTPEEIKERIRKSKPEDYKYWVVFLFSLVGRGLYFTDILSFDIERTTHKRNKTGVVMLYESNRELLRHLYSQIEVRVINNTFKRKQVERSLGLKVARKTFETTALGLGIDKTIRRQLLGHTVEGIERHYADMNNEAVKARLMEAYTRVLEELKIKEIIAELDKKRVRRPS